MKARWIFLALGLFGALGAARAAQPFASDWASSPKSRARLIADGRGQAGVQIELAPGAITYWRDPGEAGVPPTFDFAGSVNVKSAEVEFPAPKRIAEPDGGEAFGYEGAALFPIVVEPADPARPVTLALAMDYAVCEKICLPARAKFSLELPSGVATPIAGEIAAARARVPQRVEASALGAELTALDARNWRLCLSGEAGDKRDLFVEPPRGFWLTASAQELQAGNGLLRARPARESRRRRISDCGQGDDRRRGAGLGNNAEFGAQALKRLRRSNWRGWRIIDAAGSNAIESGAGSARATASEHGPS